MLTFFTHIRFANFQAHSKPLIYWGLIAVLTGFYWLPNYTIQANVFYITVLIPSLIFHWRKLLIPWDNKVHIIAIIVIIYSGLSSFWTVGEPIRPLYKGVFNIVYLWVYLAVINWFFYEGCKGKKFNLFMKIMCLGGAIIGILSTVIFYNQHSLTERLQPFFSKENLIIFAQCLAFSGIIGLVLYKIEKNYLWLVCAVLCFLIMILSQTRGVLIGTVLAIICLSLFGNIKSKIATALVIFLFGLIITQFNTFHRMLSVESERWQIYNRVLENIKGHEIFGMGLMTNTDLATGDFGYPHSLFLTTYYTGGIVGLLLLLTLIGFSLWEAFSLARNGGEITGLLLLIYSIGIYMFDGSHLVGRLHGEWLFFWLPIMLIGSQKLHKDLPKQLSHI